MVELAHVDTYLPVASVSDGYSTAFHNHPDHAMVLAPVRTSMTVRDEGAMITRRLEPRHFYYVAPGLFHETRANLETQSHIAIYVGHGWQRRVLDNFSVAVPRKETGIWQLTDNGRDLLNILNRTLGDAAPSSPSGFVEKICELVIQECLGVVAARIPDALCHPSDHNAPLVVDALNLLMADLSAPPNLDTLSEQLGVSRRHLTRVFREKTGKSVREFVREVQLQHARHLIETTDLPLTQISLEIGIDAPSQFSKVYRRFYHEAPSQTRLSLKGN